MDCHYPNGVTIYRDCNTCHSVPAAHPDCLGCHSTAQGARRAVTAEFSMVSHHVQSPTGPTSADCQACHDISAHGKGTVWLRSAEGGLPTAFTDAASATAACLSCHDDNHAASVPFSDGKNPLGSSANWDGKSIDVKFSSTEVVSSNKYPPTVTAPTMGQPYNTVPDVQRALSAHGNPARNMAGGNASDLQVPCLACHNSHGSPVAPLVYSTSSYQPASLEAFCWDCHTNDPGSPWKASQFMPGNWVKDYFGDPRWGLNDGTGFKTNWMGSFAYKNSSFMSSHLYPSKRKISDTNWPRSAVTCTSCHDPHGVDPGQIGTKEYMVPLLKGTWMVSPFKEDRAPLASFASPLTDGSATRYSPADQPRSAPDLPYNNTRNPGGGYANGSGGSGHEGYFIEDNTFGVYDPYTQTPAVSGSWKNAISRGMPLKINRITEPDTLFAGLCLNCHPKTDLKAAWPGHGTVKGWGGATRDLITSSMASSGGEEGPGNGMHAMGKYASSESEEGARYGRGYRWGVNPQAQKTSGYIQKDYHQYTCSKCHSPHATNMPRLLTTNCLDSKGTHTSYSRSKSAQATNCHSTQRNLGWNTVTPWIQTGSPVTYTIMATSNSGGTIAPGGSLVVDSGTNRTFTMTPNSGYQVAYVIVDGVNQGAITTYTFSNITADHTINATFASTGVNYTVTASAGAGGTISPTGGVLIAGGAGQTFTISPNSGFTVADVKVDNVSQGAIFSYHFANVAANHTISATFATASTITATAGAGGTISPSGAVPVVTGSSQTFTITPDLGYRISNVTTDGTSRGTISSYTFTNVTANHTISATFAVVPTYTLTASAGGGGDVSPGDMVVNSGASQTYTITPGPGRVITDVKVDNVSQGPISSYTFTNVTANHTLHATFAPITYTVVSNAGQGGTISPAGSVVVEAGSFPVFIIAADPGFAIADVKVDGVSQGPIDNWVFGWVGANHTISATFSAPTFTLSASAGAGGMITPSGGVVVTQGSSRSFTIAPNLGFKILDVKVDNVSQGAISSYTFTNVTANHTISVSFDTTTTYTITAIAGPGGSISPTGSVLVNSGGSKTFTFIPGLGYQIADVKVDNVSQGAIPSYTFTNVTSNRNISVSFTSTPTFTLTASAGAGGMISPLGPVVVNSGSSQAFAIAANTGYQIADVKVDNVSQGAVTAYTFTNVTANHTINATFAALNQAPVANAGTDKSGTAGISISFTGSGTDADGTIAGYSWNWGDGSANTTTQNASHTYAAAGSYTATLTVTDNLGATGSDAALVTVNEVPVNLALNKTATASSQSSSTYSAAKAVDGSTSTYWRSSTTGTQWVRVDLGSNQSVNNVKVVWNGSYYARTFQVQTSTDGTNFTTQYSTTSGASGTANITFAAASARYVRLYCTTANSSSYRVYEFEVYGGPPPPNQAPTADAGSDKSGYAGSAISFTGSGTDPDGTIASWSWNWGDGTADTATQNASHTYAAVGSYTATLTVTDNQGATGSDTALVTVNVPPPNQAPTANAGSDKTGNAGTAISFTGSGTDSDGTIVGYSWSWGDGSANTTTQNASHTYTAAGSYTATLTVTDNQGATGSDTALVTVNEVPVNLALNKTATASSQSSSTYSAAKAVDGSTSTYWRSSTTGTQWVRVDLGSNQSVNNVKVVWNGSYYARNFQIQTSLDGSNFTTQYSTSSGASGTADIAFAAASARYVRLYCTTANSSSYRVNEFEVYGGPPPPNQAPTANAGSDKSGYAGSAISFTGSGTDPDGTIASYSWNWGDGTADTTTQNASHTYAAVGPYTATLTVTDDQGATGSDTATVTVSTAPANQPPVANAGPDQSGVAGSAISFTGSASDPDGTITGYSWNWGDGSANTTTQNASHTYATAGTYTATLIVTDNLGAIGTDTALVTVSAAPAGVAQLNGWTNIYTAAPSNSSATNLNVGSVTVGAGSNRLLLVSVVMELSSAANKTVSASLGGTSLTQVALTANTQREIVWVGRFNDAQIGSGAKTLTITYGGSGTVTGLHVKWASYTGVNQSSPVLSFGAQNTATTSATFASTINYAANGMTVVVAGNGGSPATGTLNATPSFVAGSATTTSAHTSRTFVTAKHTAAGSYSSSTAVSWSGTTSTRSGLVAVSLQP